MRIAPHESKVDLIALTAGGDAALTADENHAIRLWPTLDGTHEPVVVKLPPPRELALGRDAHGFIAAALDDAGGIALARLDRSGALRDATLATAEAGYVQIIAVRDHLVARRRDHVIVQLAGDGRVEATLAAAPGEQLGPLVARGDHVVAAILAPPADPEATELPPVVGLRRIARDRLAWGDRITLASRIREDLAISPGGQRLVAFDADSATFVDLATGKQHGAKLTARRIADPLPGGGFLDDDHVVLFGTKVVRWDRLDPGARDLATATSLVRTPSVLAFGGALVVAPNGTGLQLARGDGTSTWLGYTTIGTVNDVHVLGRAFQLDLDRDLVWLDSELHAIRVQTRGPRAREAVFAIDDDHVLETNGPGAAVKIRDLVTNSIIDLGSRFEAIHEVTFDRDASILAIASLTRTHQLQIDLKRGTTEELPALATLADSHVQLVDRRTGLAAVAVSPAEFTGEAVVTDSEVVSTFATAGEGDSIPPSSRVTVPGHVVGIDRNGAVYVAGEAVTVVRNGKQIARIPRPLDALLGAVRRDGSQLVVFDNHSAVSLDVATGKETWRVRLWNAMASRFTVDGSAILVGTIGGLVVLDARTGARQGTACGWGFGLHREAPPDDVFRVPVVCAEEPDGR